MKRARTGIILFLVIAVMTSFTLVSFAGSMTLEGFFKKDPKALSDLKKEAKSSGVKLKIKGNTIFYIYDVKNKTTKKQAFSSKTKKALTKALKDKKSVFKGVCRDIRKETGIKNIKVVVKYTYKGKKIVSMTFKE